MPFCPKCDDEYQAGFSVCHDCQVDLVETRGLDLTPEKKAEEEEALAASVFPDSEEQIVFCPCCWNEFALPGALCAPCGGLAVQALPRSVFEAQVAAQPLTRTLEFDRLDVDEEEILSLIHVADSPLEAAFIADSLGGMGVDLRLGHDGMDGLEAPRRIGIYVPSGEEEAAAMLLPEEGEFEGPQRDPHDYNGLLEDASQYLEFRKYRAATQNLESAMKLDPARPEAFLAFGFATARRGHLAAATEAFDAAAERAQDQGVLLGRFSEALFWSAVYGFVGESGELAYDGPRSAAAWDRLAAYLELRPRRIEAWLLRLDAAAARGHESKRREAIEELESLNSQIFRVSGPHTDHRG